VEKSYGRRTRDSYSHVYSLTRWIMFVKRLGKLHISRFSGVADSSSSVKLGSHTTSTVRRLQSTALGLVELNNKPILKLIP